MKKLISLAMIISTIVLISACGSGKKLEGQWKHTNSTAEEAYILEIKGDTWTYYKNTEVLEKGGLEINGDQMIMGHDAADGHDHAPHAYTWSLSDDKTTLTLESDGSKSVFTKVE
tara:strand:+ start:24 stop:368 length:345 start_codon:yes stop_codon:yes gene_type:complete